MSGNLCFICNEPNYNGNETLIEVRRVERDETNGSMKTIVWSGMACDACLRKHLGLFSKEPDKRFKPQDLWLCEAEWCMGFEGDHPRVEPDGFCAWSCRRSDKE